MDRREILQALAAAAGGMLLSRLMPPRPSTPVNLLEYEEFARRRISRMAYDYVAGAAADEHTLRRNRECLDAIRLQPRALVDVSHLDTSLELFGQKLPFPVLLAPVAYHQLVHKEGERGTARGAGAAGATLVVSSFATTPIEDVARAATGPLWFQLYVQRDRAFTQEMVQRAVAAGCRALCITVDTPVIGARNRETRDNFHLPAGMSAENLRALGQRLKKSGHIVDETGIYSMALDPALTWEGIEWLKSIAKVPVILKGILSPADARLAVEHGVSAILVSNHGGRNLDTTPATIEALPRVMDAVGDRLPVLMDGGVRRGTDIIKALAYGARAVLIGRPYIWGLAVGGAAGVERVVNILRTELQMAMALCGVTSLKKMDRNVLWPER